MSEPTYNELIDMKEYALDKIMKAELTLTEISLQYGQAETLNNFTIFRVLDKDLYQDITHQGTGNKVCNWALDYARINRKLEIVYDYIVACRLLLENCSKK